MDSSSKTSKTAVYQMPRKSTDQERVSLQTHTPTTEAKLRTSKTLAKKLHSPVFRFCRLFSCFSLASIFTSSARITSRAEDLLLNSIPILKFYEMFTLLFSPLLL